MNRRQLLRLSALAAVAPGAMTAPAVQSGTALRTLHGIWATPISTWGPRGRIALIEAWLRLGIITPASAALAIDLPDLQP